MYLFTNLVTHKTLMLLLSWKREGKKDSAKLINFNIILQIQPHLLSSLKMLKVIVKLAELLTRLLTQNCS